MIADFYSRVRFATTCGATRNFDAAPATSAPARAAAVPLPGPANCGPGAKPPFPTPHMPLAARPSSHKPCERAQAKPKSIIPTLCNSDAQLQLSYSSSLRHAPASVSAPAERQTRGAVAPRGSCKYQITRNGAEHTRHGWVGNGSLSDESRIRGELPLTTLGRRNERRRPAPPSARAN